MLYGSGILQKYLSQLQEKVELISCIGWYDDCIERAGRGIRPPLRETLYFCRAHFMTPPGRNPELATQCNPEPATQCNLEPATQWNPEPATQAPLIQSPPPTVAAPLPL